MLSANWKWGFAAAALCLLMIAVDWPGFLTFDSVAQYEQALSGTYDDWHPPIMARIWSLIAPVVPGQGPMLVIQCALYWLGLGLLAAALNGAGRRGAAIAVLAIGLWPPFLAWEAVVLKDCQMASALLAASGLAAGPLLAGERPRGPRLAGCLLLVGYATMLRANAVFATVPLAAGLLPIDRRRGRPSRLTLMIAGILAVVAVMPYVNRNVLGARASGVEMTLPLFDLTGIARRAGPEAVPLVPPAVWQAVITRHCATPILWDSLASDRRCGFLQGTLVGKPARMITSAWITAVVSHPQAYVLHRLAHWNATMRWLVPWHFPLTIPPSAQEPNRRGLTFPRGAAVAVARPAGWLAQSPLGAPVVSLTVAIAVLALARPGRYRPHVLAAALASSAVMMECSMLVVSISSDWRYHLWSMLASMLAAILLVAAPIDRRIGLIAMTLLLVIGASVSVARLFLPAIGDDYASALTAYS